MQLATLAVAVGHIALPRKIIEIVHCSSQGKQLDFQVSERSSLGWSADSVPVHLLTNSKKFISISCERGTLTILNVHP